MRFIGEERFSRETEEPKLEELEPVTGKHFRNDFVFQETPPFKGILDKFYTEEEIGEAPSESEKQKMEQQLSLLARLFQEADFDWSLAGGLSVSLAIGDFIRRHKDIDIVIDRGDLVKLAEYLEKKGGFGIFINHPRESKDKGMLFERKSAINLASLGGDLSCLNIADVNEQGEIKKGEEANIFDLYIIERDRETGQLIGDGVLLPEKWSKPYPVNFKGLLLNADQPAKVIYYKLHLIDSARPWRERPYDSADMIALAASGKMTEADLSEVADILSSEVEAKKKKIAESASQIASAINPKTSKKEIFQLLESDPLGALQKRELLKKIASKIENDKEKTAESIARIIFEASGVDNALDEQLKKQLETIQLMRQEIKVK